jgi:hypothetical protein
MDEWCKRITDYTGETWRFKRIDQVAFNRRRAQTLEDLVGAEEPLL